MRVVVQRVAEASVTIEGSLHAKIGQGYVLLVGLTAGDTLENAKWIANKIAKLRVFPDENGKMNLSLSDVGGAVLSISQFTLYADVSDGNRPSFTKAMDPAAAESLYHAFNASLGDASGAQVRQGVFGAKMMVELANDGPVTIIIER